MSLTNEIKERIKRYLLEQIYYNRPNIVSSAAQTWNVSKTTISRYLDHMSNENIIIRDGKNRSGYKLKEIVRKSFV